MQARLCRAWVGLLHVTGYCAPFRLPFRRQKQVPLDSQQHASPFCHQPTRLPLSSIGPLLSTGVWKLKAFLCGGFCECVCVSVHMNMFIILMGWHVRMEKALWIPLTQHVRGTQTADGRSVANTSWQGLAAVYAEHSLTRAAAFRKGGRLDVSASRPAWSVSMASSKAQGSEQCSTFSRLKHRQPFPGWARDVCVTSAPSAFHGKTRGKTAQAQKPHVQKWSLLQSIITFHQQCSSVFV